VKITVIATGFDKAAVDKQVTASAASTPVDLQSYTAWQTTEKVAAAGGGSAAAVMPAVMPSAVMPMVMPRPVTRRPLLEMPATVAAADPALDTFSPGAEFEPVSPLDVPAFLRRQNE
jgi:hypothetical protein